jgi:hypothetical protein
VSTNMIITALVLFIIVATGLAVVAILAAG